MARTDVHGITIDRLGRRTIDKEHRGERIFARLGAISQEDAERYLATEVDRIEWERERRMHTRPLFSDCASPSTTALRDDSDKHLAGPMAIRPLQPPPGTAPASPETPPRSGSPAPARSRSRASPGGA